MTLSELEGALVAAIARGRTSAFGSDVLNHAPGYRSRGPDAGRSSPSLADFELGSSPPLRRTVALVNVESLAGPSLGLNDEDRFHLRWVRLVLDALAAIADRFWGEVEPPVRLLFTDADDATPLPFQSTYLLPTIRLRHPPSLRGSAARANIPEADLLLLSRVWLAARRTPAYREAVAARDYVRTDRRAFERLRVVRDRVAATTPQPKRGEHVSAYAARVLAHFVAPPHGLPPSDVWALRAFRAYNQLIHAVLVAWIAGLEHHSDLPSVDPGNEAVTVTVKDGGFTVGLTIRRSTGPEWLHVCSPFVVDRDSPLDGLYLATAITIHGLGSFSVVDLAGDRVRELAAARPESTESPV